MKRSLIIGASGGLGTAIADALPGAVTRLSRSADGFDITNETSIEAHLSKLQAPYDLIFVATGALVIDGAQPEKSIKAVTADALMDQFRTNAIGPMLILKHALRLLPPDRPATFAALSARVGSIGDNQIGGWHSYRAGKAALNQLIHGAAIELKRTHKQAIAVCLHPGTVATPFTENYAAKNKLSPDASAAKLLAVLEGLTPADTGGFFDHAGQAIPW